MVRDLKHWQALVVTFASMLVIAQARPTCAVAGDVEFVSHQFSESKIYQGDSNVYVDLMITNGGNESIRVHGASVNFDWQGNGDNTFKVGSLAGGAPFDLKKTVAQDEVYSLEIFFSVPQTVSEGNHYYEFRVFFDSYNGTIWTLNRNATWFPIASWEIHNSYERIYTNLNPAVQVRLDDAESAGFISPEAKSLLTRASQNINDAVGYKDQGEWQIAVGLLQGASSYINQAYGAEQSFRTFVPIGAIIGVAAVVVAVVFLRKRGKSHTKSTT
jgi:hypothetical protein